MIKFPVFVRNQIGAEHQDLSLISVKEFLNYEGKLKFGEGKRIPIKTGVNYIRRNEYKLIMHIEGETLMSEIYERAAKWIGMIPGVIGLSGRLYPGGPKIKTMTQTLLQGMKF
jgi:hypothetical protein